MKFKIPLLSFLLFFSLISFGQTDALDEVVNKIKESSHYRNAVVAVAVYDTKTGEKIYSTNEDFSVATASTTKLFTTAASLELLGDRQLHTRFYTDGTITDSVLHGNLWIRGGGDPALGSKYLTDNNKYDFLGGWSDSIQQLGIKSISGDIIADASEFGYNGIPNGWSWSDMGNAYGAMPSGLSIYDNIISFRFKTGGEGTPAELISMTPEIPDFKFYNEIKSGNVYGDQSLIYGAPFENSRIGVGLLQKNTTIVTRGSNPNPEFQTGYELKKQLLDDGIPVSGKVVCGRTLFYENKLSSDRYDSLHLLFDYAGTHIGDLVNMTNMHSVNMFAEQLVSLISYYKGGNGDYDKGLGIIKYFWRRRIPTEGLILNDGSGLSRSNGISVKHLCFVLNYMYKSNKYHQFFNSLPISAESGTLQSICRGRKSAHKIHAKSGTMTHIKSYAGYAFTNSGRQLTFAIVLSNFEEGNYQAVKRIENFMDVLVTLP